MARITGISKSNIVNKIRMLGRKIEKPEINEVKQKYEMDEMTTVIGNKDDKNYIMYAINKKTGRVVDFKIRRRTTENIEKVIRRVLMLNPKKIFTDHLNIYPTLIPISVHRMINRGINRIERNNLTLRTRLRRLNRKTICFSKSLEMLECSLKLYLWA